MMKIKVYNPNQIGGNFTVISANGKNVMFDYGQSLPGSRMEQELFDWNKQKIDAVFFTHYHGDHVGRMLEIPENIPLYMGRSSRQIMLNIHKALENVPQMQTEQEKLVRLLESDRVRVVQEDTPINEIAGLSITPYSVDHSAYDAYMYLVEDGKEVALHTGDFRGHGYRGKVLLEVIKRYVLKGGRKVDYLLIEGTMMGDRKNEKVMTEVQLQKSAREIFKTHRHVFLVISSTNLDSLASFYQAAKTYGMRLYCYNYYLYNQLKTFSELAGKKTPLYRFENIHMVNFEKALSHECWEETKTQEELMRERGFLCIVKPEEKYAEWIERFKDVHPLVIYSMWNGYIDPKKEACNQEWIEFFKPYKENGQFMDLHTSGHATAELIKNVIELVNPQKKIIPMHTEKLDTFKSLELNEELLNRIEI